MKSIIKISALFVATSLFAIACKKTNNSGQKSLTVMLVDGPSVVFDKIFIDIQKVEIKTESAAGAEATQTLAFAPKVYDIMTLRNGLEAALGTVTVPANQIISKIILTLGTNNSAVKNNISTPLTLKSGKNIVTINVNDDVDDDGDADHKKCWIDFDGMGSIIQNNNGTFELDPSVHHFSRHNSGEVEGKIMPSAAQPVIVKAISGTDTLFARTEAEGEFKIRGIKTNSIKLIIHPSNNYKDSVINNIQLTNGSDTKIGNITLHQ